MRALPLIVLACGVGLVDVASAEPGAEPDAPTAQLETVIVKGQRSDPLEQRSKPKQQDKPADDGAQALSGIPGVALSRQSGVNSAPLLRGLGGSRLPIVVDGAEVDGACNHGMDPATAYINPDSFDRLTVIKGPNTVRYGLAVGGLVSFERLPVPEQAPSQASATLVAGAFGRLTEGLDATLNTQPAYLRVNANHAQSDDYEDGNGVRVHSHYWRRSNALTAGWRVAQQAVWEVDTGEGNAQMAFPSVHMDGTRFRKLTNGTRLLLRDLSPVVRKVELRGRWQSVDHLMDDFSMRAPNVRSSGDESTVLLVNQSWLVMDQSWRGRSSAVVVDLELMEDSLLSLGFDGRDDQYDAENNVRQTTCTTFFGTTSCASKSGAYPYYQLNSRVRGYFAEWTQQLSDTTLKAGGRWERVTTQAGAINQFNPIPVGPNLVPVPVPNGGSHDTRVESPHSLFGRAEQPLNESLKAFAAVGYAQRPADYVERGSFGGFYLNAERNRELDVGLTGQGESWSAEVTAFHSRIKDFIITNGGTRSENHDARRVGAEAQWTQQLSQPVSMGLSATLLHADDLTDGTPLPQTPPREARVWAAYGAADWNVKFTGRFVDGQNRVKPNWGTTTGQDIGPTPGFSVFGISGAYRPHPAIQLQAGVDNLFDRAYAEHVNHTGSYAPAGFIETERVPEPGRAWWVRLVATLGR